MRNNNFFTCYTTSESTIRTGCLVFWRYFLLSYSHCGSTNPDWRILSLRISSLAKKFGKAIHCIRKSLIPQHRWRLGLMRSLMLVSDGPSWLVIFWHLCSFSYKPHTWGSYFLPRKHLPKIPTYPRWSLQFCSPSLSIPSRWLLSSWDRDFSCLR